MLSKMKVHDYLILSSCCVVVFFVKITLNTKISVMLLLVKCYDNKMVKLPGCSSIGMLPCG